MTGLQLLQAAGFEYNSTFRSNLSNLVKRKHLRKTPTVGVIFAPDSCPTTVRQGPSWQLDNCRTCH